MRKPLLMSLLHKNPVEEQERSERETQVYVEKLTRELATAEIDTRFRDALEKGEITGDVVALDDFNNPAKDQPRRKNILGL